MSELIELMRERLAGLAPESLEIEDESAQHAGHEGAKGGGGHYRMTIVSPQFAGLNSVARHRVVYQALGDLMGKRIHALSITAFTPEEF
ncbi:MAG: BolA family transcriptional regulator [Hydrogenophilaceae bacterium]|nr:BolA family transcriptional regulator [Hydrogenophilaceae bacterium]